MSYRTSQLVSRGIPLVALVSLQAAGCGNEDRDQVPDNPIPTGDELTGIGGGTCGDAFAELDADEQERIFLAARRLCEAEASCDDEITDEDVADCELYLTAALVDGLKADPSCRDVVVTYYTCWSQALTGACPPDDDGDGDITYPETDYEFLDECFGSIVDEWDRLDCYAAPYLDCELGDYDYGYVTVTSDAGVAEFDVSFSDGPDAN